jgi:hypothetical protein
MKLIDTVLFTIGLRNKVSGKQSFRYENVTTLYLYLATSVALRRIYTFRDTYSEEYKRMVKRYKDETI